MSDPTWSMRPWSGTLTNLTSSNPLRKCRNSLSGWPPETGTSTMTPYLEHDFCDIQTLQTRRHNLKLCFLFQVVNGCLPFPNAPLVSRPTLRLRNSNPHLQPVVHSKAHQFSFFPHSISLWNQLPNSVYDCDSALI